MDSLLIAALAFSLSQILLSVILFIRIKRRWSIQQWLYGVFLVAVTGYLLTPLVTEPWLQRFMGALQTLVPGCFWLFTASLFDDHFKLRPRHWGLVAVTVVVPLAGDLMAILGMPAPRLLFWALPQSLEFVLMGLALWAVVRFWQDDLVESRRDLRLWFCGVIGLYIVTLLLFREILYPGAEWLSVWQYVPVGVVLLITNGVLLEHKTGLFHPPAQPQTPRMLASIKAIQGAALAEEDFQGAATEPESEQGKGAVTEVQESDASISSASQSHVTHVVGVSSTQESESPANDLEEVPEEVLQQLTELMETDLVYREMGLTIGQLAVRLELPEYRLRRIINAGLGYRNFNDFLNTYRIREASQRLIDPDESDEAVLNIALDVGFRSLSSFNKAFKQAFSKTPTEYRNQHAVDA